jgi:hypothetical protein
MLGMVDYVRSPGKGVWTFDRTNPNRKYTVWKTWQASKSQVGSKSQQWWETRKCQGIFQCNACEYTYAPRCSPTANAKLLDMFKTGQRFRQTNMTGKALNVQFNLGAVDPNFGDANKLTRAMRAQDREDWPHGKSFAAIPHLNNKLGEEFVLSQTDSLICYQTQWMKDVVPPGIRTTTRCCRGPPAM